MFDYTNLIHNTRLLTSIFAKSDEEKLASEKMLSMSMKYAQGFVEEIITEALRKKGFIIDNAEMLHIVAREYTANVVLDYLDNGGDQNELLKPSKTILLLLEHLGVETELGADQEAELQQLDAENLSPFYS